MPSTLQLLRQRLGSAIDGAFGDAAGTVDPQIRRSQDERFGDYQCNAAMGLAKALGAKPREVAERIVTGLSVEDLCETPQIAGPGFINLKLKPAYVASALGAISTQPGDTSGDRLGQPPTGRPLVAVVDLSSPNLAKEMHVGHLRSTVIGDCVARILEFAGHAVYRVNHVGDWGTQFGMLLAYLRRTRPRDLERPEALVIDDLEKFYVEAKALFDSDPDFAETGRQTVVQLQSGDPQTRLVWQAFCRESLRHCHAIYARLDVTLEDRGESFYNSMLPEVVATLEKKGLLTVSDGASCLFLDGFTTREGQPLPMIVRKTDGAYNYDTTDLAALYHRLEVLGARRLIYVVGAPQKQHFDMLFAAARKIGWAGPEVALEHLAFGNMLGADGRPFRTRTGGTVKLKELLDEAVSRARKIVEQSAVEGGKGASFDEATIQDIAATVGLGAIKYFDLSHGLSSDYKFDWDTMLAMDGNTAPYLLYAYARIRSIARKADAQDAATPSVAPMILEHESELRLGKTLLRFGEIVDQVVEDLRPNILTDYLYELSKAFSTFYDRRHGVRVLDAETAALRHSRLDLCHLTARTLKVGLHLLGIRTLEQM